MGKNANDVGRFSALNYYNNYKKKRPWLLKSIVSDQGLILLVIVVSVNNFGDIEYHTSAQKHFKITTLIPMWVCLQSSYVSWKLLQNRKSDYGSISEVRLNSDNKKTQPLLLIATAILTGILLATVFQIISRPMVLWFKKRLVLKNSAETRQNCSVYGRNVLALTFNDSMQLLSCQYAIWI